MINNFKEQIEHICIQLESINETNIEDYYHEKYLNINKINLLIDSMNEFFSNLNNIKSIHQIIPFDLLLELLLLINQVKLYAPWLLIPEKYKNYNNLSIINKHISILYNKHINYLNLLQIKIMDQNLT